MVSGASAASAQITIAVCSRQRPQQLQRWVTYIMALIADTHIPVLVIEQSTTRTPLPTQPGLIHLHVPGRGLARARNLALRQATTPFVAFCDDDCLPSQTWVVSMRAVLQRHPDVAIITGSTWPSGTAYTLHAHHTQAGYTTWAQRADGQCCTALHVAPDVVHTTHPLAVLEVLGQGNNMVVNRRSALARGGFHPWLGAGAWLKSGEDVAFMLEALCAQQHCIYAPAMRITHDAWQTPAQLANAEHGYTVGMLAVHIWYALRGVAVAQEYLTFRWQQLMRQTTTNATVSPQPQAWKWARARAWVRGMLGGLALVATAWWRPV